MTGDSAYLIAASAAGIAIAIWLIARIGLHPFVGLLSGALAIGLFAGLAPEALVEAIEKGFADILKGTGLVVALGLSLGAMLQVTGGAQALARRALSLTGERNAHWGALFAALLIGLPLFFETGVVLLLPIIAAGMPDKAVNGSASWRLKVMLSALAGLSVLHALLPPHPGPLIAVKELGAPLLRTMLFGLIAAVPTALIAGPWLATITTGGIDAAAPVLDSRTPDAEASPAPALFVLLLPVGLIASGAFLRLQPGEASAQSSNWIRLISEPPIALLIANLIGLVALLGRKVRDHAVQQRIWTEAFVPAGTIILAIGAGGSLKQVLVTIGLPDVFARLASLGMVSPVLLAWLVAAAIRVATGSATVATITAAGIMSGLAAGGHVDPVFLVLAIGAGSVVLSHVNDPGFWLVKGYLGTSTKDTFRTWTALETVIAVVGGLIVYLLNAIFGL